MKLINVIASVLIVYLSFTTVRQYLMIRRMMADNRSHLYEMRPLANTPYTPTGVLIGEQNTEIGINPSLKTGEQNTVMGPFGLVPYTPKDWSEWINNWARQHPDFTVVSPITPSVIERAFLTIPGLQHGLETWQSYLAHYNPTDSGANNLCIGPLSCTDSRGAHWGVPGTRTIDIRP